MDNRVEIESWVSSQSICPWVDVSSVPDLRSGELHLWWVPLQGNDEELEALRATLSTREKEKMGPVDKIPKNVGECLHR